MELRLALALPRDAVSVPVVRRLLRACLEVLGVEPGVSDDVELALTEAATNVLGHSQQSDEYEVSAGIDGDLCVIEVVDRGSGFDGASRGLAEADTDAEGGRGIQLIRTLVDRVEFNAQPHQGTVVHLEKRLEWRSGSAMEKLKEEGTTTEHGPWTEPPAEPRR